MIRGAADWGKQDDRKYVYIEVARLGFRIMNCKVSDFLNINSAFFLCCETGLQFQKMWNSKDERERDTERERECDGEREYYS